MVKDHSDSERGNPLPPHRLLFPISSNGSFICIIPTDRIIHTTAFVTPVVEHWLEREDREGNRKSSLVFTISGAPRLLNATSVFDNSSVMASTFRCTNGEFISLSLVCDKTNDCYDGSDELSCGMYTPTIYFIAYRINVTNPRHHFMSFLLLLLSCRCK